MSQYRNLPPRLRNNYNNNNNNKQPVSSKNTRSPNKSNTEEILSSPIDPNPYSLMLPFMAPIPIPPSAYKREVGARGVTELMGDLLQSDCDVVIQCCNCFHTMGAGIAKSIRAKWPEVYEIDKETPFGEVLKLGHYSCVLTKGEFTVINLYAQFDYGRPEDGRRLHYDALRLGLQRLVNQLIKQNAAPKIGTYYLGCTNAGGDKAIVRQILEEIFVDIPLFLYTDVMYISPAKQTIERTVKDFSPNRTQDSNSTNHSPFNKTEEEKRWQSNKTSPYNKTEDSRDDKGWRPNKTSPHNKAEEREDKRWQTNQTSPPEEESRDNRLQSNKGTPFKTEDKEEKQPNKNSSEKHKKKNKKMAARDKDSSIQTKEEKQDIKKEVKIVTIKFEELFGKDLFEQKEDQEIKE